MPRRNHSHTKPQGLKRPKTKSVKVVKPEPMVHTSSSEVVIRKEITIKGRLDERSLAVLKQHGFM